MPRNKYNPEDTADSNVNVLGEAYAWIRLEREAKKRLAERLKEYKAPPTPYMPGFNNVLVLRLPSEPTKTVTAGGLHIPMTAQEEEEPKSEGILVQAGLMARDTLRAHGYLLGDKVQIGRFAGWEKEFRLDAKGENQRKILQMKDVDVLGSFDLNDRLWGDAPTMEIVYDIETAQHRIRPTTGRDQ